jgi:hypothetical protein
MHDTHLFFDFAFIISLVIGFGLIPFLQIKFNSRYLFESKKKLGPDYWGNIYPRDEREQLEPCISVNPPARELTSVYGRQA